jgi:hypothetical protein
MDQKCIPNMNMQEQIIGNVINAILGVPPLGN